MSVVDILNTSQSGVAPVVTDPAAETDQALPPPPQGNPVFDLPRGEMPQVPHALLYAGAGQVQGPAFNTRRAMSLHYDVPDPTKDVGFLTKLGIAFTRETVTSELIRDARTYGIFGGRFQKDSRFTVTDRHMEEYASDLPEEVQRRIREDGLFDDAPGSFVEFLQQVDDARVQHAYRQQMFAGGGLDMAGGFLALMIGAGIETIPLTMLATAAMTPAGGAATLAARAELIKKGLEGARFSLRTQTVIKTLLTNAAVDVPLEGTRYLADKTMRPIDFAIAMGASSVLSGGMAAVKPQWFSNEMRILVNAESEAAAKEAMERAARAVDPAAADEIAASARVDAAARRASARRGEQLRALRLAIAQAKKEADEMSLRELRETARQLGVEPDKAVSSAGRVDAQVAKARARVLKMNEKQLKAMMKKYGKDLGKYTIGGARRFILRQIRKEIEAEVGPTVQVPKSKSELLGEVKEKGTQRLKEESPSRIRTQEEATPAMVAQQTGRDTKGMNLDQLKEMAGRMGILDTVPSIGASKAALPKLIRKAITKERLRRLQENQSVAIGPKKKLDFEVDDDILNPFRPTGEESPDMAWLRAENARKGKKTKGRVDTSDKDLEISAEDRAKFATDVEDEAAANAGGVRRRLGRLLTGDPENGWRGFHWWHVLFTPTAARMAAQESAFLRELGVHFLENPMGGGPAIQTIVRAKVQRSMARLNQSRKKAQALAKKNGWDLNEREVLRKLRNGTEPANEAESIYIGGIQKFYADAAGYGRRRGVLSNELPDNSTYFHRVYNQAEASKFIVGGDKTPLIEFFAKAIRSTGEPSAVKKFKLSTGEEVDGALMAARRIVDFLDDPSAKHSHEAMQRFVKTNRGRLVEEFGGEAKLTSDQKSLIDGIMDLATEGMSEPFVAAGRRRIRINEDYRGMINGQEVHIDQFFKNDVFEVSTMYAQRLYGAGEVREAMRALAINHPELMAKVGTKDGVVDPMRLLAEAKKLADPKDAEFVEQTLNIAMRSIQGMPIYSESRSAMKWMLRLQSLGQSTIGMYLGLAQLPEMANIVMRSSMMAAFKQFNLREMINTLFMGVTKGRSVRDEYGILINFADRQRAFQNQLETHFAVGVDYDIGEHVLRRMDEMGIDADMHGTGYLDRFLEAGREFSMINPLGIIPMDTFLRRWATKSNFQWFVDTAYQLKNGKPALRNSWWRNRTERFRQLGLDDAMIERISKELTNPDIVQVKRSFLGGHEVMDINLEKMADKGAYDALVLAMRRSADSMVQRQSLGELPLWLASNPLCKTLMQYRVFMIASKGKQLGAGMARGDAAELVNLVGSAGLGAIGYMGLTYARQFAVDPEDRDAWLNERLSQENMIKSGIARASYSTIWPTLIDSTAMFLGASGVTEGEPVFNKYARTSDTYGLDPYRGSVAYSMIRNIGGSMTELLASTISGDDPLSRQDLRDFQKAIWLAKIPGVDQALNEFISRLDLPATDRRD